MKIESTDDEKWERVTWYVLSNVQTGRMSLVDAQETLDLFREDELKALHQELQKAREEEVSNIIADYMEALGTVQLPQEVWLWIADINGKYLNKTLKENI
jgi:hypothetical protein